MNILLSVFITLAIVFIVPVFIYSLFTAFFGLKEPDKKLNFMLGVLLQKIGTSIGFVGIFYLGRNYLTDNWMVYSLIWFVMFALNEVGQVVISDYSKKEAVAGIISEAIYFSLAGAIIATLLS